MRAGRSREAPDGPVCDVCGKGGGYLVGGGPWSHVRHLAGLIHRPPKPDPVPQPQLFDPDA